MEELQLDAIRKQTKDVLRELMEKADLKQGQILVVGCSSSEIGSFKIGSHSSGEIGQAVYEALYGKSMGLLIERYIGKTGRKLFLLFCWLFTLIVIAAFAR